MTTQFKRIIKFCVKLKLDEEGKINKSTLAVGKVDGYCDLDRES